MAHFLAMICPLKGTVCGGFKESNTPVTRGGPGGRDRTLAVKRKEKTPENLRFFVKKINIIQKLHISSNYAKIL